MKLSYRWGELRFPRKLKKQKPPKLARRLAKRLAKMEKRRAYAEARAIQAFNVPTLWELDYHQMMSNAFRNMAESIQRNNSLYTKIMGIDAWKAP
jgi:hypothetical protein